MLSYVYVVFFRLNGTKMSVEIYWKLYSSVSIWLPFRWRIIHWSPTGVLFSNKIYLHFTCVVLVHLSKQDVIFKLDSEFGVELFSVSMRHTTVSQKPFHCSYFVTKRKNKSFNSTFVLGHLLK